MLDCLATLAHSERVRIKALLHSVEQMLMLPSWKPSLWPCRALRFERTTLTGCGPVAPYPLAIFLASKAISQLLPSRAPIGIFLRQIDKVTPTIDHSQSAGRSHPPRGLAKSWF